MRKNMRALSMITIFIVCLLVSDTIFAQGPINNAQQFQQKAINSALKGSKNQNYGPKQEYIEWVGSPASAPADTTGKVGSPARTGDQNKASPVTK